MYRRISRIIPALALVCAVGAVSSGARAADPLEGLHETRKPPSVMSKVSGIAGPTTRQPIATKVAADGQATGDAQPGAEAGARSGERRPSSGPARVKPGVGPGNGNGVRSKGPAPR